MDDLVVIILTLIVAVVGTIGQIKKKKADQATSDKPVNKPDFWDLIEGETEVPMEEQAKTNNIEFETSEPVVLTEPRASNLKTTPPKSSYLIEEQKKKERLKSKIRVKDKFSLREAVVFSEILNRKYS